MAVRIDPSLLVILAMLLKTRSVSRAAAQLKTSQPSVSRALALLRTELGDPLLVRSSGGMTLTRRAEELVEPVQNWLNATATLLEPPCFEPRQLERRFRVASTDFGVLAVIAPALPRLMEEAPRAAIDVVGLKGGMIAELASGEVDLLVSGLDPNLSQSHERFLFTDDFSCLFRAGHPLAGDSAPVPLEQYLRWPHIAVTVGDDDFDRIESRLGAHGQRRRVVASIPYFGTSPSVIGASDAVVTLPSRAARALGGAHGLHMRPAPVETGSFGYHLLWHERTERDPASIWLRDLLAGN
ncbi:LysR family transcriptional regulator [Sphingomonas hankookensis]|uniref:LysR family transcriptional regulator n=1 Tax=Sphingomonas hengshuiensis TaxID=1609977 RepID=A0A2W4YY31_9SPHN|nr:MAG: LysR family transcriptional regulator [Sphingomonas hengshuiensis]